MTPITPKLNLVIPVEQGGLVSYVHSAPLSREVFERYFLVIARTFSRIYAAGLGEVAGPRVAALMLKQVAQEMNVWDGPTGAEVGLIAEFRRLSNVIGPGGAAIPLQEAVDQKLLSPDDLSEVENALAFFMVTSAMHRRSQMEVSLDGLASLWGGLSTSLNCTEYAASLRTQTVAESTGAKVPASSVPY